MKCLLLLGSALVLCVSLGDCLECYTCFLSPDRCIVNPTNCTRANDKCYYRVGKAGAITVYMAGCLAPDKCNTSFSATYLSVPVSLNTTCCNFNLCNESSHVKSSLLLGFALVSLWFARFL